MKVATQGTLDVFVNGQISTVHRRAVVTNVEAQLVLAFVGRHSLDHEEVFKGAVESRQSLKFLELALTWIDFNVPSGSQELCLLRNEILCHQAVSC